MQSEVLDVLKTFKLGKASGPDGINDRILIEAAGQLAPHLCDLFNQSLFHHHGKYPMCVQYLNLVMHLFRLTTGMFLY